LRPIPASEGSPGDPSPLQGMPSGQPEHNLFQRITCCQGRGRGGGAPGLGRGSPGRGPGAGSSVFGCVRGPGGAGGGGLGGRWVVCGRAGRCRVRRLPAVVFSRSGLWFFPVWGFCVPIGLVWSYDTRSVRGYSIHTLFSVRSEATSDSRSGSGPRRAVRGAARARGATPCRGAVFGVGR